MKTTAKAKPVNWKDLPDPITEAEVKIQITWTADKRTTAALTRQAKLMRFATPTDYLHQGIAAILAGNEEDTFVLDDGSIVGGWDLRH